MEETYLEYLSRVFTFDVIIYILILLIGTIYNMLYFEKLSKSARGIGWILTAALICELLSYLVTAPFLKTSYPSYHLMNIAYAATFTNAFYWFFKNTKIQRVTKISGIGVFLFCIVDSFIITGLFSSPDVTNIVINAWITVLSLILFLDMVKHPEEDSILSSPAFWFNLGSFLYFAITFFFSGLRGVLVQKDLDVPWIKNLHSLLVYFMYITFLASLILDKRRNGN